MGPDDIDPGHYGPDGPVAVCWEFLDCIFQHGSYDDAWPLLDENHRRCRAQAWIWNNREFSDIAGRLEELSEWLTVGPHPGELIWDQFCEIELRTAVDAWAERYRRGLGAGSRPRPVGPDLEVVVLVPTDGDVVQFTEETLVTDALVWLVRRTSDGLRLAGWSDREPVPGLPPDLYPDIDPLREPAGLDPVETVEHYLDILLELEKTGAGSVVAAPRHDEAWALMTFDLRSRMARLMTDDIDRIEPNAVSTILEGPNAEDSFTGGIIWNAFRGWHAGHISSRYRLFRIVATPTASVDVEGDAATVTLTGDPDAPQGYAAPSIVFGLRRDGEHWKIDSIPDGVPHPPT